MNKSTKILIIEYLKLNGQSSQHDLVEELGITKMAVSRHLNDLLKKKYVVFNEIRAAVGRPVMHWELTPAADIYFPDKHADLTVSILGTMEKALGQEAVDKIIEVRSKDQLSKYTSLLKQCTTIESKLKKMSNIRSDEGYLAEYVKLSHDEFLFIENHCPICSAAKACISLCDGELMVLSKLFGPKFKVQRTDHLLDEDKRCAYLIQKK